MSNALPFQPRFVGKPVPRLEDPILLTGRARFVDDLQFPGMLHIALLRSPHAHARIRKLDVTRALASPGVVAVLTGMELAEATKPLNNMPPLGGGWAGYAMAVNKVRYCGEIVAAVAATTRHLAEDAAEQIDVDYQLLAPVVDPAAAMEAGAALLYEDKGSNVLFHRDYVFGEPDAELERSHLVVRGEYRFPRVSGNPMETNGLISRWDTFADELTCWCNAQAPGGSIAAYLKRPPARDHIIGQPHGGSFGTKLYLLKYQLIAALLSRRTGGRHVKYIEDRMEHLLASGTHAWDRRYEAAFGFDEDGRCRAMSVRCLNDAGASAENSAPSMCWKPVVMLAGPYKVEHFRYDLTAVVTNKSPEGAYRGYGCPPHTLVIERMMDKAARQLGMDPVEIRRRNLIQATDFPYRTPSGTEYDSGDYPGLLDLALERSGFAALRAEQQRRRAQGRIVGLSAVMGIEPGGVWAMAGPYRDWTGGAAVVNPESASLTLDAGGRIDVEIYYALEGQGQYTFAAQIIADCFGLPMESVRVRQAESRNPSPSMGPMGSRSAVALSGALVGAADRLAAKLKLVAAVLLQCKAEQLEVAEGQVRFKGGQGPGLPLGQVAGAMTYRPDLLPPEIDGRPQETFTWRGQGSADTAGSPYLTYAAACHVVLVEIDRATGQPRIERYVIADDCGTRLNPALVEGQVQGGVAQGTGAALYEEYCFDDQGQPLAVSFADYLMPTIFETPMAEKHAMVTPSPNTVLGTKGTGEGAIHVTPAAIFCAINDALAPLGVELTHCGAKPERIWHLLQQA